MEAGNVSFSGNTAGDGFGNDGFIAAGGTTGTLKIYDASSNFQGTLDLTEGSTSSPVTNNSWNGMWTVTETPDRIRNFAKAMRAAARRSWWGLMSFSPSPTAVIILRVRFLQAVSRADRSPTMWTDPTTISLSFSFVTMTGSATSSGQVRAIVFKPRRFARASAKGGGDGQQNNQKRPMHK